MKLEYVINSVDTSEYFDLWKYTSKFIKRLNYTPVLFLLSDTETDLYENDLGLVKQIKVVPDVPVWQQAQLARIWGTKFFEEKIVMTSDIDMFLLNKNYFDNSISPYGSECFINLTSNAYTNEVRIPICYNIAKGDTFNKLLNLDVSFNDFIKNVKALYGINWDSDERFLARGVVNYEHYVGLYRPFNEKWEADKRIDRNTWSIDFELKDTYIDCHFLRPLQNHLSELNNLLKLYGIQ